jgi:hypothetical protein
MKIEDEAVVLEDIRLLLPCGSLEESELCGESSIDSIGLTV